MTAQVRGWVGALAWRAVAVITILGAAHTAILLSDVPTAVAIVFGFFATASALLALRAAGVQRIFYAIIALGSLCILGLVAEQPDRIGSAALIFPPFIGYALVSGFFAWSLLPGQEPVILRMSRVAQGEPLAAGVADYARVVTWAWALVPAGLAILSVMVLGLFGLKSWSWIVNVANPLLLAAFFLGEHLYRRWRLPHFGDASLSRTFNAMRDPASWWSSAVSDDR